MASKRIRPCLARTVATPPSVQGKVQAILRLSREITKIADHYRQDLVHAHDRRSALALERKHNRRGELLALLREQDQPAHHQLVEQLKGDRP